MSYELQDNTSEINILGRTYMGIDTIDKTSNVLRAGYGIQVLDNDNQSFYRNILYVNNDSELQVNSIKLGGHYLQVDTSGNLLYDGVKIASPGNGISQSRQNILNPPFHPIDISNFIPSTGGSVQQGNP